LLKWTAFGTFSARVRTPRQPYSPKLVEDEFSEIQLHDSA
jgi:hypothetical protein